MLRLEQLESRETPSFIDPILVEPLGTYEGDGSVVPVETTPIEEAPPPRPKDVQ